MENPQCLSLLESDYDYYDYDYAYDYSTDSPYSMRDLEEFFCHGSVCPSAVTNLLEACKESFNIEDEVVYQLERQLYLATELLCVKNRQGQTCLSSLSDPVTGEFKIDFAKLDEVTSTELAEVCLDNCFDLLMDNLIILAADVNQSPGDDSFGLQDTDASRYVAMSKALCFRDQKSPVIEYCLNELQATPECFNVSNLGYPAEPIDPACTDDLSDAICHISNCHARVYSMATYLFPEFEDEPEVLLEREFAVGNLCVESFETATDDKMCAAMWIEEEIRDWSTLGTTCEKGLGTCASNPECQAPIDDLFARLGCCYTTGYDVYAPLVLGLNNSRESRQHYNYLVSLDSWFTQPSCNNNVRREPPACPTQSGSNPFFITVNMYWQSCDYYFSGFVDETTIALKKDFAVNLGVSLNEVDSFTVRCNLKNDDYDYDYSENKVNGHLEMSGIFYSNNLDRNQLIYESVQGKDRKDWFLGNYQAASAGYYQSLIRPPIPDDDDELLEGSTMIGVIVGSCVAAVLLAGLAVYWFKYRGVRRGASAAPAAAAAPSNPYSNMSLLEDNTR